MRITVEATCDAPAEAAWKAATTPDDITAWNAASPDWHCPHAAVDLRVGGRMTSSMEARDGSAGFDFAATFTKVDPPHRLEYRLDDDRMVSLEFRPTTEGVHIRQTFDAEAENDAELQRAGWQAILDSFVRHVEGRTTA